MSPRSAVLNIAVEAGSVRTAREFARAELLAWGASAEAVETARLLVSEIVTNAVTAMRWVTVPDAREDDFLAYWTRVEVAVQDGVRASAGVPNSGRWPVPSPGMRRNLTPGLELRLSERERRVLIEVRDGDPWPPVLQDPEPESEGGRGVLLTDSLSEMWGWYWEEGRGKVVWCLVALNSGS